MSNTVSALEGLKFSGIAAVREVGLQGMVTLRGDLASEEMKRAVKAAVGTDVPGQRDILAGSNGRAAWMSPDELLLVVAYGEADAVAKTATKAFGKSHALAVNVSDARVMFEVKGNAAREVLAKLAPVDLSPDAFKRDEIRRTRLAQVPAAFWMEDADTFRVVAFRSVARYVFDLLKTAAADGSEVGIWI